MLTSTRFINKVKVDARGCWIWLGVVDRHGYGKFRLNGRMEKAHRAAYVIRYGAIPAGLEIDHVCRVRRCVNPEHLRAVTKRENTLIGESPPAVNARKVRCVNGHPFDDRNTYIAPNGVRQCRACNAARSRAYKQRKQVAA